MVGYMPSSGSFMKIWLIIVYSLWGALCCFCCYQGMADSGNINIHLDKTYREKYERVGDKPLGKGDCAIVWKVKKRHAEPG